MVYQFNKSVENLRESYAYYLGRQTRNAVQETVQLAGRLLTFCSNSLDSLTSPDTKIINTRPDHDERHKGLHEFYHRCIKSS